MSTPRHDSREIPKWGLNLVLISQAVCTSGRRSARLADYIQNGGMNTMIGSSIVCSFPARIGIQACTIR